MTDTEERYKNYAKLVAAGFAKTVYSKTCLAPIERIKMILQTDVCNIRICSNLNLNSFHSYMNILKLFSKN